MQGRTIWISAPQTSHLRRWPAGNAACIPWGWLSVVAVAIENHLAGGRIGPGAIAFASRNGRSPVGAFTCRYRAEIGGFPLQPAPWRPILRGDALLCFLDLIL